MSILAILEISGFFIADLISFNDLLASTFTSGWVSEIVLEIELTI